MASQLTVPVLAGLLLTDDVLDLIAEAVTLRVAQQHQPPEQRPEWLDVDHAAAHLAASKHRIYRLVHMQRIPCHRDGKRLLFDRAELDAWVRSGGARRVAP